MSSERWTQGLLVCLVGLSVFHQVKIWQLTDDVARLSAGAKHAPALVAEASPVAARVRAIAPVLGSAGAAVSPEPATGGAASVVPAQIDDHLWSEQGRAVIDDVVAEREEASREQMRGRWRQMMQMRTERAVDKVAEELELVEEDASALSVLVSDYMSGRSEHWRKMHDPNEDMEKLQAESDEARQRFEDDVVSLIGEDGLDVLGEALERRRGF